MKKLVALLLILILVLSLTVSLADSHYKTYEEKLMSRTWEYQDTKTWKLDNAAPNLEMFSTWNKKIKLPSSDLILFEDGSGHIYLFAAQSYRSALAEIIFADNYSSFILVSNGFAIQYK